MHPRHFLDLDHFDSSTLRRILDLGNAYKQGKLQGKLQGKILAMIFEKPSTRTRVSFEVGMRQLGGDVIIMGRNDTQLGRNETLADTARVLSRYVNAVMIRTDNPQKLLELAQHATIPVINGLTDSTDPCQIMADIMTFEEHRGSIKGKTVAWSGDGNNVAASFIQAAALFEFELRLACPEKLMPEEKILKWAEERGGKISLRLDPKKAVLGADCVVTDTWVSMGQEDADYRRDLLEPYQVNQRLMALAKPDAVFMHCLPAHRSEEVTAEVIDGPNSLVWDEAENRLHVQKGILAWCLGED